MYQNDLQDHRDDTSGESQTKPDQHLSNSRPRSSGFQQRSALKLLLTKRNMKVPPTFATKYYVDPQDLEECSVDEPKVEHFRILGIHYIVTRQPSTIRTS